MKFKIEREFVYGWDDAGWVDEIDGVQTPTRFNTYREAEEALCEHIDMVSEAVDSGDMAEYDDISEYRIIEASS